MIRWILEHIIACPRCGATTQVRDTAPPGSVHWCARCDNGW